MPAGPKRSFANQLVGKGTAQHLRESASQAIKESSLLVSVSSDSRS